MIFKVPLSGGPEQGSYPSIAVPTGAKQRVQSPLERWPLTTSTDRPEMESRSYEFLLQLLLYLFNTFTATLNFCENLVTILGLLL